MSAPRRFDRPDDRELPRPPLPLLVTGIAGVNGYGALRYFSERYPGWVWGLRQVEDDALAGPNILVCNFDDPSGLRAVFDRHRFAVVLDCEGSCALKPCELDPRMAWRVNVESARCLLANTVPRGVRLVRHSIDLVFSGQNGGAHVETDPTDPVTVYGKTMAAAERIIAEEDPTAAILRISLPMSDSLNGHAGAIDWIENRFKHGRPATLYYDEIRTPTYTDCLNRVSHVMLASDHAGIFHAGGPRRLSLFQIAQIVNRAGGYDPDLLHGMPRHHAGPIPPRAGDVTMNSTKLERTLGYRPFDPWPLDDSLVPTDRRWHYDRPHGEPRGARHLFDRLAVNPRLAVLR